MFKENCAFKMFSIDNVSMSNVDMYLIFFLFDVNGDLRCKFRYNVDWRRITDKSGTESNPLLSTHISNKMQNVIK